ncbi:MAG: ABC transporter permease [Thermodesulfovibrionales bacterium]|nr:ABC transporter permease [Thermodesulfovibrionales bacterium]
MKSKISIFIVLTLFFLSLLSPFIGLKDPNEINLDAIKEKPSLKYPFGTDNKGRDIFARVIYGAKISIGVSIVASCISALIGLTVGLIAGYKGGIIDKILMSIVDFILSFPSLLFAIAISIVFPAGLLSVMIAISAVGWTSFARLIRSITLSIKNMPYVESAIVIGCSHWRIILKHIAPQCLAGALVMIGIKMGGFILTEATLSFLGLGLQPPEPSWGSMVSAGRNHILTAPWIAIFPGLAIFITVFSFNIFGEYLRQAYNLKD